jgi:TM2 domain-containing membrane protein YozV
MKALAIILNVFVPGVGTLVVGKIGEGITQLLLWLLGVILVVTVLLSFIGVPLCIAMFVWSIVSAATSKPINQNFRD